MPRQTHFEVHVLQRGRWGVHAQYPGHQKDSAVEEGRALSGRQGIDEVKVIKEVFDSDEGTHHDYIIFKSTDSRSRGGQAGKQQESSPSGGGGYEDDDDGGWGDDDDDDYDQPAKGKKPRKKSKLTTIIVKLLLVTLLSVCIAGMFTWMTTTLLSGTTLFGVKIRGNAEANLLFIVFVGTFLLSAVGLAVNFLKGENIADMELPQRKAPSPQAIAKAQAKERAQLEKQARNKKANEEKETKRKLQEAMRKAKEKEETEATTKKLEEGEAINDRLKEELSKEPEKEEAAPATEAEAEAPNEEESVETSDAHSANVQKQKAQMMKFLGDILDDVGTEKEKMDNFNKFGVNLFLAGACESLSEKRDLDENARSQVLADGVRVMGFKKSHAASFADRYEEYLLQDPRYMQMFQAGRNSMNTYFTDEVEGTKHLGTAMEEWNKPKAKEEQAGPITVLFTDIAGSTAMTQALGDAGAQEVVRAHNRVVRAALTSCNGKEVKHTGDGIMASFARTTDGVDASIQMQRETAMHNQQHPNLPLHLKIGLNSGEPIAEDNDLFGSTVQMSARIVDKAQADEIFVSEVVRGICAGKAYVFINRGGYAMKGFEDDPILYEVDWRAQAAAE